MRLKDRIKKWLDIDGDYAPLITANSTDLGALHRLASRTTKDLNAVMISQSEINQRLIMLEELDTKMDRKRPPPIVDDIGEEVFDPHGLS